MQLIFNGPPDGPLFLFTHGADAPATSDFMEIVSTGLAEQVNKVYESLELISLYATTH